MCLQHLFERNLPVLVLKEHKSKSELAFGGLNVLRPELFLKEVKNDAQMLLGLFIVVAIDARVSVVLYIQR